jgi:predicted ATPase
MNTDADMPSNLSDAWLSAHQFNKEITSELRAELLEELRSSSFSSVSYLKAMIDYSRISAKVWEAVYAAHIAQQPLSSLLREYIEASLSHWQETLPQSLVYDKAFQPDSRYPEISRTIIQQRFLLYVVCDNSILVKFQADTHNPEI